MIAELVAHAGDNPDDAADREKDREETEGLRAVETGDEPRARVVPVTSLRTSAAKEESIGYISPYSNIECLVCPPIAFILLP